MATPPKDLTERQLMMLDKMADQVIRYRMAMPAILFLESVKPLNYVGSQAMVFLAPIVHSIFTVREYDEVQQALEHRETIAYFVDLLEEKENVVIAREKAEKQAQKTLKPRKTIVDLFRRHRGGSR